MSKIIELIVGWEGVGGTLLELVDGLRNGGTELADSFGVSAEEVTEFLALSDRIDAFVAKLRLKTTQPVRHEDHRTWVKRTVRELMAKQREWAEMADGSATAKSSGGNKKELPERQAEYLRRWLQAGQPMREFFEINLELGSPSDYELRPFIEDDKGWLERINEGGSDAATQR